MNYDMKPIVKVMDNAITKLNKMKLYEMTTHKEPYFRKMRVESGFMYNFYDCEKDEYMEEWIFVPDANEWVKELEHYKDITLGLWATDRPDLIDDPKELLFELTDEYFKNYVHEK